jgi:hypothetical protein
MRRRFLILSGAILAVGVTLPAVARNHGTTPGLEGPATGKATVPAPSTQPSPGQKNPTTAPVAPISPSGPAPDAPGKSGTSPGQLNTPAGPTSVTPGSKR